MDTMGFEPMRCEAIDLKSIPLTARAYIHIYICISLNNNFFIL